MSDTVIETTGLRKEYWSRRGSHVVAVHGLDLAVPRGGVHGFLGPNGSGKTTTIRMLLGLSRPTRGTMTLLGHPIPTGLSQALPKVGAVVESPKFTPGFSGRRNLELLARTGGVPDTRVDDVVERVGLRGREQERFGGYSLGMKQRLAIAATLLKDPELLVLDEPTNGLDPAGIRDIRDMVRELGSSGVTVLISSHILAEVQQVCDSVSIIARGRLLASGRVDDLLSTATAGPLRVGVGEPDRALEVLRAAGLDVRRDGDALLVTGVDDAALVSRLLGEQGLWVSELVPTRADLESYFLELTHGEGPGADPGGGLGDGLADPGPAAPPTEGGDR